MAFLNKLDEELVGKGFTKQISNVLSKLLSKNYQTALDFDTETYGKGNISISNIPYVSDGDYVSLKKLTTNPFLKLLPFQSFPTFSMPTTITSIVYIDPSSGTNGTGTIASPRNVLPGDFTFGNNTAYLFKSGTTYTQKAQLNSISNIYFGSYGSGAKPKWTNGSGDRCVHLSGASNVVICGIAFSSNNLRCISNDSAITNSTSKNITIYGCEFSMTVNSTLAGADTDCNAISLYGADNKVIFNRIYNIPTDGIWMSGNNAEMSFNTIYNVATDGRNAGDCLQLSVGDNFVCRYNYLDHSATQGKQCIMGGNSGTGSLIEYNYCKHQTNSSFTYTCNAIYSGLTNSVIRRNIVLGGQYGIMLATTNAVIESNYVEHYNTATTTYKGAAILIPNAASTTVLCQNNTIIGISAVGGIASSAYTASPTNISIKNNIITGFGTAITNNNTTNTTAANNIIFNCTTKYDGAILASSTNTFEINPKIYNTVPQEPLVHNFGVIGSQYDLYGNQFVNITGNIPIGCVQADGVYNKFGFNIQYCSILREL
jgi:hypothetical protein